MKIHDGVSVDVYRNLHKNTWSIRSRTTGRVVEHSDNVLVRAAKFVVQPAGRKRVLQEQRKNVHAFWADDHADGTVEPFFCIQAPLVSKTTSDACVTASPVSTS